MRIAGPTAAKWIGAAVGAAIAGASGAFVGRADPPDSKIDALVQKVDQLSAKVDTLSKDVALVKCALDFPGDCPGQAKRRP